MQIEKGIFIIGYRKAGTTSVFDALLKHNNIKKPFFKESQFFCMNEEIITNYFDWFKKNMVNDDLLVDGSTLLVHFPEVVTTINKKVKTPFYIVCVKNPIKRMYSAYLHMSNKYGGKEKRSFHDIIRGLKAGEKNIIETEFKNLEIAVDKGLIDPDYFGKDYHKLNYNAPFSNSQAGNLIFYRYYYESLYSKTIEPWLALKNTHLVVFESLLENPNKELNRLYNFLELKHTNNDLKLPPNQNVSFSEGNMSSYLRSSSAIRKMKSLIPESIIYHLKALKKPTSSKISRDMYDQALPLFEDEFNYWFDKMPDTRDLWLY